ncbi:hypothetical protein FZC84_16805 [Rossellomorea vietnamensis]|uniref:Uncharacterized protein n=1 Tax=Rossellomorea vietnamensis TaxID=218284 RepID=A0A5D4M8P7_9BACI|nr:hypothetical protein [Rossellomorea vietnamensis]TYR98042.1 hypothetical protein FZC84_16805 [Rossellomorea vietnamensis]
MHNLFQFLKWVIQAASIPIILVLVWFFDIRPFTSIFNYLDDVLKSDLSLKIKNKGIPPTILGAIDVALLTFIYNFLNIVISKVFSKPARVSIELRDRKSNKNFIALPFEEEKIGMQSPSHINLVGEIEIKYGKWVFDYILKGIRVNILWHSKWLSVEPQLFGASDIVKLYSRPGKLHFNLMDMLSESEPRTEIDGRLSIMANSNFKRDGHITIKVELNSSQKLVRLCFNWIILMLIKIEIKPCIISLEKGR